jgi:hypothetical protein
MKNLWAGGRNGKGAPLRLLGILDPVGAMPGTEYRGRSTEYRMRWDVCYTDVPAEMGRVQYGCAG